MIRVLGGLALALVVMLTLGPVAALLSSGGGGGFGPADWSALRFTLLQAVLSAALSVGLAVPLARALARRAFPGRTVFVTLLGAPFLLPVIVAVFGIVAIWGRAGPVSDALEALGYGRLDIYGLQGVVLAHVFFNLPLATRLILSGWAAVPAEHFRLLAQLGAGPRAALRLVEWPVLRRTVPGALLVVFLLCLTSFAVALTLGGGPAATTLELAIYEVLRFEFDLGRAAVLALVQLGLCLAGAALALSVGAGVAADAPGLLPAGLRPDRPGGWRRLGDGAAIAAAGLFLGAPLVAVLLRGLRGVGEAMPGLAPAALRSLGVALVSTTVAMALGLALAALIDGLRARGRPRLAMLAEGGAMLALAASPFVMGTGLYLILRPVTDPFAWALAITALVNAAMSLPFALRLLLPALARVRIGHGALADSLGMAGWARFRLLTWPLIRAPAGFAAGLAAALSMGDLGVIALFARPEAPTLPLYMHGLMGAYRLDAAALTALVLVGLSLGLFALFDRLGGGRRI